jgi:hypothetical protein
MAYGEHWKRSAPEEYEFHPNELETLAGSFGRYNGRGSATSAVREFAYTR